MCVSPAHRSQDSLLSPENICQTYGVKGCTVLGPNFTSLVRKLQEVNSMCQLDMSGFSFVRCLLVSLVLDLTITVPPAVSLLTADHTVHAGFSRISLQCLLCSPSEMGTQQRHGHSFNENSRDRREEQGTALQMPHPLRSQETEKQFLCVSRLSSNSARNVGGVRSQRSWS